MDLLLSLLIALLGHPDFATRERATSALSQAGIAAEPYLELAAQSPDPEVRWRATRLLVPIRLAWLERHLAERPAAPWLDALPLDYPNRAEVIHGFFGSEPVTPHDAGPHREYRAATRAYLRFLVADGASRAFVVELLRRMDARCPAWQENRWTDE